MKQERQTRIMIGIGAAVALLGITLAVGDDDFGRYLIVGGAGLLFVALHRFGRLGPDAGANG